MSVEGNWNLKISSPMGEQSASMTLAGADDALTGSVTTQMGGADITGKLDGDSIEFSGEMSSQMGAVKLDFTGSVSGDEISGSVQFGSFGSGDWSATRA